MNCVNKFMKIIEKVKENYLFGCIKYKELYQLYLMPIAYWILNYQKYDPQYNPAEWDFVFRDNILNVSDDQFEHFFKVIDIDKVLINELKLVINRIPVTSKRIYFYIDFDGKKFVNGFEDIAIEEYLPNLSWSGNFDNPLKYVNQEIKLTFSS